MKRRLQIISIAAVAILLAASFWNVSTAQRRFFQHSTPAHKNGKYASCASCHSLPTKNWTAPRRDKDQPFPDVATFPSHTSCFGCHTKDIYSAGGAFCGTCHTVPTMRARAVLAFPIKSHAKQFETIFPHDVHQDLIASVEPRPTLYRPAHFVKASFTLDDEKQKPTFYNCAICHTTAAALPRFGARKLTGLTPLTDAITDKFDKPVTAEFFKDSPDGHASCFTCHYQYKNLPQGKQSCAGCHALTTPYTEGKTLQRYSIKFDHDRVGHVEKDCTSCHLRITQQSDIRTMKDADVPIASCKACHATQEDDPSKKILFTEIDAREKSIADKTSVFQCTYCHTSAIGRYEIPASHKKP